MIAPRIHAAGFPKQLAKVILGRRRRRHGGGGGGSDGVGQYYDRRWFTAGPVVAADAPTVPLRFVKADGSSVVVDAREGESLLQTAHRFDIGLEGACEGGELYFSKVWWAPRSCAVHVRFVVVVPHQSRVVVQSAPAPLVT
jgi:hypothetical protein